MVTVCQSLKYFSHCNGFLSHCLGHLSQESAAEPFSKFALPTVTYTFLGSLLTHTPVLVSTHSLHLNWTDVPSWSPCFDGTNPLPEKKKKNQTLNSCLKGDRPPLPTPIRLQWSLPYSRPNPLMHFSGLSAIHPQFSL